MPDLQILIKKSASTATLRGYANHNVDCEYLIVPSANAAAAITELGNIGADFSIYSASVTEASGNVAGILVPKEAGR